MINGDYFSETMNILIQANQDDRIDVRKVMNADVFLESCREMPKIVGDMTEILNLCKSPERKYQLADDITDLIKSCSFCIDNLGKYSKGWLSDEQLTEVIDIFTLVKDTLSTTIQSSIRPS